MSIFVKIIFNRTATSRNEDSSTQASWLSIPIVYSCQNPNDVTEIHEIVLLMEDPLNDPDLSLPITRMILVSRLHTKNGRTICIIQNCYWHLALLKRLESVNTRY